jgi:hypothetical protein
MLSAQTQAQAAKAQRRPVPQEEEPADE